MKLFHSLTSSLFFFAHLSLYFFHFFWGTYFFFSIFSAVSLVRIVSLSFSIYLLLTTILILSLSPSLTSYLSISLSLFSYYLCLSLFLPLLSLSLFPSYLCIILKVGRLELENMELEQHRIVHESILKGKDLVLQKLR